MNDWVIGVDLGGTKIEVGLVSPDNRIVGRTRIPTDPGAGPESVVRRIAEKVSTLTALLPARARIAALGLCSPGPVDHEAGTLLDPPNLGGLHYAPLQRMLSERLGIPVCIDHDAKATGLGEYHYGAGKGERSMAYVIVGTGVGSAIILNGQVLRGQNNIAGEIGHIPLDRNGEVCSCGSRGCVETFISGPWLARRYERKLEAAAELQRQGEPAYGYAPALIQRTAVDVVNLALQGDLLAREVMDEAGSALGAAVATLAMVLDLDLFVVGGSVVKSGDLLLEPARRAVPQHCYRSVGCGVRIVATELGDDGPLLGCAWMARDALEISRSKPAGKTGRVKLPGEQTAVPAGGQEIAMAGVSEKERLEAVEGTVFNIQRFSLHDGPGLRTDVFFKGCPLRCAWCANPESQRFQPELALSMHKCIRCGQHTQACPDIWDHGAITQEERQIFAKRAEVCPMGAMHWLGARRTAKDVLAEVLRDRPFYPDGGGMTLTGGEPTAQPDFAEALLRLAKGEGLSTAMETSGHTRWKILERLLPYLDLILFDIKHLDTRSHRAYTGVDNDLILANLHRLAEIRAPVAVRIPLIPGFNADPHSLGSIARFIAEEKHLSKQVGLLPYHTLGRAKYASLGREYPWDGQTRLSQEDVYRLAQGLEAYGLEVTLGS